MRGDYNIHCLYFTRRQEELEARLVEEETTKRVEELVAKRVQEELERRKDEIEAEVLRRVEEAKKVGHGAESLPWPVYSGSRECSGI